jgi:NADPH2:quinone reductase
MSLTLMLTRVKNYTVTAEEARYYGTEVFRLIADGTLKVKIFKEYPFTAKGVQDAHRELSGGRTVGKLVVKVAD